MYRAVFRIPFLRSFAVLALFCGAGLAAQGASVPAKAWLSQHLIEYAWHQTLDGHVDVRPWPWMDSHPVAKISIPKLAQEHVVMSGVSGAVMAFSPGWHDGTNLPGDSGISLIAAHKDTHFRGLGRLETGDSIRLQMQGGAWKRYRIEDMHVVETPDIQIENTQDDSVLVLSTCYPFSNWQLGGSMRFVVVAREVEQGAGDIFDLAEL